MKNCTNYSIVLLFLSFNISQSTIDPTQYPFCPPGQPQKTIEEQNDPDGLNQMIKDYVPVIYIYNDGPIKMTKDTKPEDITEKSMPTAIHDFFGAETSIAETAGAKGDDPASSDADEYHYKEPLIAEGEVTMRKLYELHRNKEQLIEKGKVENWNNTVPVVPGSVYRGSDPAHYHDEEGNLTVPIHAATFEKDDKLYIQYYFFFGHNPAYEIKVLGLVHVSDEGQHQADLEHMTLEFDKETRTLQRVFYGSHGPGEGSWMDVENTNNNEQYYSDPHDQRVEFEDGTHIVGYSALNGHGFYPHDGNYVRILGHANDHTKKGIRWFGQVTRIFSEEDENFDVDTTGWAYGPYKYGPQAHIPSLASRPWFLNNSPEDEFAGNPDNTHFCGPDGNRWYSPGSQRFCTLYKSFMAWPPKNSADLDAARAAAAQKRKIEEVVTEDIPEEN